MAANWFIGLPVDTAGWYRRVITDVPDGVRVMHPDDVHVTVAFLGRCGRDAALAAWTIGEAFSANAPRITLSTLRGFGNPRKPSALSVVLSEGHAETVAIIAALQGPMIAAAGAQLDTRAPHPHITVARPTRSATAAQRRRALAWAEGKGGIGASVTLDRLALYTWSEERHTRQFQTVATRVFQLTSGTLNSPVRAHGAHPSKE